MSPKFLSNWSRQARLRLATGLYLLVIYATLPLTPVIVLGLFDQIGRGNLFLAVNILMAVVGILTLFRLARARRPLLHRLAAMVPPGIAAGFILWIDNAVERVHFLEYGLLGWLVHHSLTGPGASMRPGRILAALGLVTLAGLIDESIQYALPNRVWDPRDLAMNAVGGAVGLALAATLVAPIRGMLEESNQAPSGDQHGESV